MPKVTLDVADVVERSADDRGRVHLGPEFADATVEVAVVDVVDDGDESDEAGTTEQGSENGEEAAP